MKINVLILFAIFSIFFISCDKNMKRINSTDLEADQSEIEKICAKNEVECGYITGTYQGVILEINCGECKDGYKCVDGSNICKKTDETDNNSDTTDTSLENEDDKNDSSDDSDSICTECSTSTTSFPCKDSDTGYIWSGKTPNAKTWQEAKDLCTELNSSNYGGFSSGWHLPTISELRTLIQNCPGTVTGGSCGVTDRCLVESLCWLENFCDGCDHYNNKEYSKLNDNSEVLWSSSSYISGSSSESSSYRWVVDFSKGKIYFEDRVAFVRCVR